MDIIAEEETLRLQRVSYLVELAQLRKVTLPQLMIDLGLKKAQSKKKHG
jgi:hypothetical protein